MAITASVLLRAQYPLEDIFKTPNSSDPSFNRPYVVAKALLENQTATMVDRLLGNDCVGIRAYFMRSASTVVLSAPDCDTPAGPIISTVSRDYDNAILVGRTVAFEDTRCNQEIDFVREQAIQMRRLVTDLRTDLAALGTTKLASWSQVNQDTGLPDTWDATTESPRILVPKEDFRWDMLGEFEATVENNLLGEHFWLTGRNFYHDFWESQYRKFNDNERAGFYAFNDVQNPWYFDLRNIDAAMGYKATFAVAKNNYVFWNATFSTPSPTDVEDNVWTYTMADPELKYMKDGRLVPVMYEMETTKVCLNRDAPSTKRHYKWTTWGRLLGGLENAPVGPNGENAALQFKNAG